MTTKHTRHTRPYFFMDPGVAREVGASRVLFAMWVVTREPYAPEVHPLHDRYWRRNAQSDEEAHLALLKKRLALADAHRPPSLTPDLDQSPDARSPGIEN